LSTATNRRLLVALIAAVSALALLLPTAAAAKKDNHSDHGKGKVVSVMTRNLYLGADLTPALKAESLGEFVAANGQILREVTANDFPTRAKGLAQEILSEKPDLVGLQEVALWRTGPPDLTPVLTGQPTATAVRYDYLAELLAELNRGPDPTKSSSSSPSSTSRRRLTRTVWRATGPTRRSPTLRSTGG